MLHLVLCPRADTHQAGSERVLGGGCRGRCVHHEVRGRAVDDVRVLGAEAAGAVRPLHQEVGLGAALPRPGPGARLLVVVDIIIIIIIIIIITCCCWLLLMEAGAGAR